MVDEKKQLVNYLAATPKCWTELEPIINDFIQLPYNDKIYMAKKSRNIIEKNFDERIVINKYISVFKEILLQNKD